jgi:hypothetical protein
MHSFSFFDAEAYYKDTILRAFNKKSFKGHKIIVQEAGGTPYPGKKTKEKDKKHKKKKAKKTKVKIIKRVLAAEGFI